MSSEISQITPVVWTPLNDGEPYLADVDCDADIPGIENVTRVVWTYCLVPYVPSEIGFYRFTAYQQWMFPAVTVAARFAGFKEGPTYRVVAGSMERASRSGEVRRRAAEAFREVGMDASFMGEVVWRNYELRHSVTAGVDTVYAHRYIPISALMMPRGVVEGTAFDAMAYVPIDQEDMVEVITGGGMVRGTVVAPNVRSFFQSPIVGMWAL